MKARTQARLERKGEGVRTPLSRRSNAKPRARPAVNVVGILLAGALMAGAQTNLLISTFRPDGVVVFNELTNASEYRVEWSTNLVSPTWSTAAPPGIVGIPAAGSGTRSVTVGVAQAGSYYRVVAMLANPSGMALIPAGIFVMGNATNVFPAGDGGTGELPQHAVHVSAFYLDLYEVTKSLWDEVRMWATNQGYAMAIGDGKATHHPVHSVNWYDAVKWCNARSEREGLTPVYYTNAFLMSVYKTGETTNLIVNGSADGYRLPTEAEWEKAARGGVANTRFPWTGYTNKISWSKANYIGNSALYAYDLSGGILGVAAYHPLFDAGGEPCTSPVGHFAPNGYGLHDMAGNVWEWCWDWYLGTYYPESPPNDPRGPAGGSTRVLRGGSWNNRAIQSRVSHRHNSSPINEFTDVGFRCARSVP